MRFRGVRGSESLACPRSLEKIAWLLIFGEVDDMTEPHAEGNLEDLIRRVTDGSLAHRLACAYRDSEPSDRKERLAEVIQHEVAEERSAIDQDED